ncbi:hypothetical protein AVEN_81123-1, partial [Araneus ventricosus]
STPFGMGDGWSVKEEKAWGYVKGYWGGTLTGRSPKGLARGRRGVTVIVFIEWMT